MVWTTWLEKTEYLLPCPPKVFAPKGSLKCIQEAEKSVQTYSNYEFQRQKIPNKHSIRRAKSHQTAAQKSQQYSEIKITRIIKTFILYNEIVNKCHTSCSDSEVKARRFASLICQNTFWIRRERKRSTCKDNLLYLKQGNINP